MLVGPPANQRPALQPSAHAEVLKDEEVRRELGATARVSDDNARPRTSFA
jgi:hypothetical protein